MSAPLSLLVPAPALAFKAVGGSYAPLEDVLALSFPAVRLPDGSALGAEEVVGAQALLSRTSTPGGSAEVWDPSRQSWRAASGVELGGLSGVPLLPPKASSEPWQGIFVAAGQQDLAGLPLIQAASAHFPQYRWRGAFRARRNGIETFGLGPESAPVEFASATAAARVGIELDPDADRATRLRIVLRNAAAQPLGFVEIDASSGNALLTLANFDASGAALAAVTLQADGSIRLRPAGNRKVIVAGDLEVEHIRFLPAGGSVKKDLS